MELNQKSDEGLNDSSGPVYTDAEPASEDREKLEVPVNMVSENYDMASEEPEVDLQSPSYENKSETILSAAAEEDYDELSILRDVAACAGEGLAIHLQTALQVEETKADIDEKARGRNDEEEVEILIQAAASADENRQTYSQASVRENNVEADAGKRTTVVNEEEKGSGKCEEETLTDDKSDEEVEETERPRLARSPKEDEEAETPRQVSPSLNDRDRGMSSQQVCTEDEEDSDVTRQRSMDSSEESESLTSETESDQDLEEEKEEEPEEEDDTAKASLRDTDFYLSQDLLPKLYTHQKDGVLWLWGLHKKVQPDQPPVGGILGDDMGLGKTIQIIAFLSGLFLMKEISCALIVVPVTVMVNWHKEFKKWAPAITVASFHGAQRQRTLDSVQKHGGVLLTTYGTVVKSWQQLSHRDEEEFVWDYVILDEGHKIKNPTKTTKGINAVGARHRVIMTGTPIQNNLKELWTLFDYTHQSTLFGSLRSFKSEYETPIVRSRERDASHKERKLGIEKANKLKVIIDPYFLRRTKADVTGNNKGCEGESSQADTQTVKMPEMTYKNDLVIWLYLSDNQLKIYRDFLELDDVKELLMTTHSPLVALNVLKKICDHPRLLSVKACHQLGLHGYTLDEQELSLPAAQESAVSKLEELSDDILVDEAGKMGLLISLLDKLRQDGHRCLIFSQSRKMLDIIQKVLKNRGHKIMRLDGKITQTAERDRRVQEFQQDESYSVFLLTTQVGGVGLTLTSADRVIIYDPSWNPATDAQAVDRAFRIGQTRNVVVYRLITCGTVEEKIYRRQIFKDSITRQTTGNAKDPYRYFTKQDLFELFSLGDPRSSTTQQQLQEMHGMDRRRDPELDQHIAFLGTLPIFGISDHDLMFSQEMPLEDDGEDPDIEDILPDFDYDSIQRRLEGLKQLWERESLSREQIPSNYRTYGYGYDFDPLAGKQVQPYNDEVVDLTADDDVIDLTKDDCLTEVKVNHWSGCHWKKRNLAEYTESSSPSQNYVAQSSILQRWPSAAPLQLNPIDWKPYLPPTLSEVRGQENTFGDTPIKTIFEEGVNEGLVPWDRMVKSLIERPRQTSGTSRSPEDQLDDYFFPFLPDQTELNQLLPQPGHGHFQTSSQHPLSIGQSSQQSPGQYSFRPHRPQNEEEFEGPPYHTTGSPSGQTHLAPVSQNLHLQKHMEPQGFLENPDLYNSSFESYNPVGPLLESEQRKELDGSGSSAGQSLFLETEQKRFNLENSDHKTLGTWQNQAVIMANEEQDSLASWHDHIASENPYRYSPVENEETGDGFQYPDQHLSIESTHHHLIHENISENSSDSLDHNSPEDSRQNQDFFNTPNQYSVSDSEKSKNFEENPDHSVIVENGKLQNIFENPRHDPISDNERSRYVFENSGRSYISECGRTWDAFVKPDQHRALNSGQSQSLFESSNQQSWSESGERRDIFENPDEQPVLENGQIQDIFEDSEEQSVLQSGPCRGIDEHPDEQPVLENGQIQDIFEDSEEQSVLQSGPCRGIDENPGPRTSAEREETQDELEDSDCHSVNDSQNVLENLYQPSISRNIQSQGASENPVGHVGTLADPAHTPVVPEAASQLVNCERSSSNPRKRPASNAGEELSEEEKAMCVSKYARASLSADSGLSQSSKDSFSSSEEAEWTNRSVSFHQSHISVV